MQRELGLSFRPDIEGLRGLAVLMVVAFHVGTPLVAGGFVGVDVFFVISGFLITALLVEEAARTGSIRISAFVARRIRRLLPAAAVVFIATLALSAVVEPPLQLVRTALGARAAASYVSNVHFYGMASDYFSGDVKGNPTLHAWSLSVEEQFYLAWPWLLLLFSRVARNREFSRRRIAWALAVVSTASFAAAAWYTADNRSLAFYGMPLRAWEFGVGGLVSVLWASGVAAAPQARPGGLSDAGRWSPGLGWLGLGLVLFTATSYTPATDFPGVGALLPVTGTSLVLASSGRRGSTVWGADRVLSWTPLQWIGRRSYSWYLWHWPLLVLVAELFPKGSIGLRAPAAGVALALADLTYRFIETPTRKPRDRRAVEPSVVWRTIAVGAMGSLLVVAASELVRLWAIDQSNRPAQRAYTAAAADVPMPYRAGCVDEVRDDRVRPCIYGAPSAVTTVALFGDSHAVQWFPAVERVAEEQGWSLIVLGKTRCPTADVPVYDAASHQRFLACERWRRAAIDTLRRRDPAVVLLSNADIYIRSARVSPELPAVSVAEWQAGMQRTLELFHELAVPVMLIRDTPHLSVNVPVCLARSGWIGRAAQLCGTSRFVSLNDEVATAERHAVAVFPEDRWIDLSDHLCGPTLCPPIVNGVVAYSDNEHLSARMSRALDGPLSTALKELGWPNTRGKIPSSAAVP